MRDPKRIPRILGKLQRLWEKYPDQRFGQLLENYLIGCPRTGGLGCIHHIEDDKWEEGLDNIFPEVEKKNG